MDLLEGIKGNKFVVFGRAGMDMFADPVGTKSEFADTFKSVLGGSSANICVGLCNWDHRHLLSLLFPMRL